MNYINGEGQLVKCRYELLDLYIEGPFCDPNTWYKADAPTTEQPKNMVDEVEKLSVFPNPSRQNFVVTYETQTKGLVYGQVHNVQGVALYQWQGAGNLPHEVHVATWPNGLYVVTLQTPDGKVVHKRVVVQH
jgi:hypothetical protein